MAYRRRVRRVLKWGGLMLSLVIGLAWVGSHYFVAYYSNTGMIVGLNCGDLVATVGKDITHNGWAFGSATWVNRALHKSCWPLLTSNALGEVVFVPLWLLLPFTVTPAAFLFWRDRRRIVPGHCHCGYDLTGNTSGTCPECGTAVLGRDSDQAGTQVG